jgi:hypothetical protein
MKLHSLLTGSILAAALSAAAIPAMAFSITDVTTNTVLFAIDFENGTTAQAGTASFGSNAHVINAASPGPAEGSFYAELDACSFACGRLDASGYSLPSAGDLIRMSAMLYIPSATDTLFRADFELGHEGSPTAKVFSNGSGGVEAGSGGSAVLNYLANKWQEWDIDFVVGGSTFTLCIDGSCTAALTATGSAVDTARVINASSLTGPLFVDGVAAVGQTPLPAALPLFASGLGAVGFAAWHRKRKARAA